MVSSVFVRGGIACPLLAHHTVEILSTHANAARPTHEATHSIPGSLQTYSSFRKYSTAALTTKVRFQALRVRGVHFFLARAEAMKRPEGEEREKQLSGPKRSLAQIRHKCKNVNMLVTASALKLSAYPVCPMYPVSYLSLIHI